MKNADLLVLHLDRLGRVGHLSVEVVPGRTIQTAVLIKMETLSDTEYRCYPDQSQLSIEIS